MSAVIDIIGLVGANGAAGVRATGDPWSLVMDLVAWRKVGGAMQRDRLIVCEEVTHELLTARRAAIGPYQIVRFNARFEPSENPDWLRATVTEFLGVADDSDLATEAIRLQQPVLHTDPRFGVLRFSRELNWYEGRAAWMNTPVKLYLEAANEAALADVCPHAYRLWDEQIQWDSQIRPKIIAEFLDLKNETWRDEDEPALSADEFIGRLSIDSIMVHLDGSFIIYYNDDDMFSGHSIEVLGSFDEGITAASLAG